MPKAPQKAAPAKPAAAKPAAPPVPAKEPAKPAAKASGKSDHVFLVDGSSYIFRAYHALPPLNRKSDGLQVNAVLGFCNMLWKLLRDMPEDNRPTHLAIIFDKSEITFRNKLYPDYKAHRPPAPDDLIPQFSLIRDAVRAFDLPCLEQNGFEADDLIATYARLATERGATTTIVSSDKDLMQLVTDKVLMYDTMKDRRIGIAEVIEKFGVPPEKVVEVQALAGDSTDNVPGVPGIGIKTAAQLIVEYGDLEQLLFRAGEIKQPKRRESLLENAEKARISRQLVLLDDKVELETPLDDLAVHEPDARKLIAFLKAMEFSSLTKRVAEYSEIDASDVTADGGGKSSPPAPRAGNQGVDLLSTFDSPTGNERGGAGGGAPAKPGDRSDKASSLKGTPISLAEARKEAARKLPVDRAKYQTIRTIGELKAWIGRAREAGRFAIELKANSIDPMQADICGIALALAPNDAAYVPLAHKQPGGGAGLFDAGLAPDQIKESDALEALKPLLESAGILKIGFNIKFGAVLLAQAGITLRNYEDVQLMSLRARCRAQRARARHAGRALARACHADPWRADRQRQEQAVVRSGRDRQGDRLFGGGRRRHRAAVAVAEAAPRRRSHDHGVRDPGAAAGVGAGAHGAPRHLDRPPGAVAPVGRVRADRGPRRGRAAGACGRADQCRQPQADRRHHLRQDGDYAAAPRPRPVRGRPRRRSSMISPSRATNFRRRFWSGGRSRS